MFSGQYLLVLGGIMIFSMVLLTFYKGDNYRATSSIYNEAILTSTGVAQSLMEEILIRDFDEKTISDTLDSPSGLTSSHYLGGDASETEKNEFDDVDDFDGFTQVNTFSRLGSFYSIVDVYYINPSYSSVKSSIATFHKRIDVSVTNQYLADTLNINHIISY